MRSGKQLLMALALLSSSATAREEPEPTRILVLGTPHLRAGEEEHLEGLLEVLASLEPDAICVESMPGRTLEVLGVLGERYQAVLGQFAGDALAQGKRAQEYLGLSRGEAEELTGELLADWSGEPFDSPRALELVSHLLASYDIPSAVLQWFYLRERGETPSPSFPPELASFLDASLGNPNEIFALAVPLAARLGLKRLDPVDDHQDKDDFLRIAEQLMRELNETGLMAEAQNAQVYARMNELRDTCNRDEDLLPLYRYVNSPDYSVSDIDAQWRFFLRSNLASGLDRTRLALWDVRNLNIASNVRRVSSRVPGGRVVVLIGAGHKPFLDDLLGQFLDVEVVQWEELEARTPLAKRDPGQPRATKPRHQDEWYLPTEDGRSRLFVREYGEGEPVIVLHGGWGAEHSYLVDVIAPHLSRHRFILYDQRGSLRSPAPPETISVEQHVADLEHLRKSLGIEKLRLFAHSMGTFLALSYLDLHPDRVADLVLAGALPPRNDGTQDLQRNASLMTDRPEVAALLTREGLVGDELTARQQTHAWRIQFAAVNLFHVERWRDLEGGQVFYSSVAGGKAAGTMPESWDFVPVLGEHPSRVTVLLGDHDYVDWRAAAWTASKDELPEVDLRILKDAGHAAWIDRPRAFAAALATAWDR